MKKLEFETSKGAFFMVDAIERKNLHNGIFLKQITEEQASDIVDESFNAYHEHSFVYYGNEVVGGCYIVTAIESLHSLLKSKGIHLFENPVPQPEFIIDNFGNGGICESWVKEFQEQEEKTFYNPVIFKL